MQIIKNVPFDPFITEKYIHIINFLGTQYSLMKNWLDHKALTKIQGADKCGGVEGDPARPNFAINYKERKQQGVVPCGSIQFYSFENIYI